MHVSGLESQVRGLELGPNDSRQPLKEFKQEKGWVTHLGKSPLVEVCAVRVRRASPGHQDGCPGQRVFRGRRPSVCHACPSHSTHPRRGQHMCSVNGEWQINEYLFLHRENGFLSFTKIFFVFKM